MPYLEYIMRAFLAGTPAASPRTLDGAAIGQPHGAAIDRSLPAKVPGQDTGGDKARNAPLKKTATAKTERHHKTHHRRHTKPTPDSGNEAPNK